MITVSTTTAHKIPPDLRSPGEDPGDSGDEPDGDGPPLLDRPDQRPDQRLDQRRLGPRQGSNEQGSKEIATTSMGAGFFISPDGYAVTTDIILEDSDTVQIRTSDKQSYAAKVVGRDPLSNLALIKVDGRDMEDAEAVTRAVTGKRPGDRIALELFRTGQRLRLELTLVARPPEDMLQRLAE